MIATWDLKDKSCSNVTLRISRVGSISMDLSSIKRLYGYWDFPIPHSFFFFCQEPGVNHQLALIKRKSKNAGILTYYPIKLVRRRCITDQILVSQHLGYNWQGTNGALIIPRCFVVILVIRGDVTKFPLTWSLAHVNTVIKKFSHRYGFENSANFR